MEVETEKSQNVFVKTIKTLDETEPKVISVHSAPHIKHDKIENVTISSSVSETITVDTTVKKSDSVGHTVTESTHLTFISGSIPVQSTVTSLTTSYSEYSTYSVKYTKIIDFGKQTQVILTLEGPSPTDTPIQVTGFYDLTTKTVKIVHLQEIDTITISSAPVPLPTITTTHISEAHISETIKKDTGLKTVITQITKSSTEYQKATVTSAEVQVYDEYTIQYNIVMDVKGEKQHFVHIYNKTSNVATPIVVTPVPKEIKPILYSQTKIDSQ